MRLMSWYCSASSSFATETTACSSKSQRMKKGRIKKIEKQKKEVKKGCWQKLQKMVWSLVKKNFKKIYISPGLSLRRLQCLFLLPHVSLLLLPRLEDHTQSCPSGGAAERKVRTADNNGYDWKSVPKPTSDTVCVLTQTRITFMAVLTVLD